MFVQCIFAVIRVMDKLDLFSNFCEGLAIYALCIKYNRSLIKWSIHCANLGTVVKPPSVGARPFVAELKEAEHQYSCAVLCCMMDQAIQAYSK
jgi:hypothetical protein